jgi:hypothetical protein
VAAFGVALSIILLVVGVPFTLTTIALLIVAFTALLGARALRLPAHVRRARSPDVGELVRHVRSLPAAQIVFALTLLAFLVLALIGLYAASDRAIGSRVWLSANGIHGDHSIGESLNVSYLLEHRSRVWGAVNALVAQIQPEGFDPRMFVPLGLAIVFVALFVRGRRRAIPAYYLTVGLLYFIGLVWAYWTSPFTGSLYDAQVYTTAPRITVALGLIGLAAVLQLGEVTPASPLTAPKPSGSSPASPLPPPAS